MLKKPVEQIKGIGPARSGVLKSEAGIKTVEDLLYNLPRAYVDRTQTKKISECGHDESVTVFGTISSVRNIQYGRKRLEVVIEDMTGNLTALFFGGFAYFSRVFIPGTKVVFFGKIIRSSGIKMFHPDFDFYDEESGFINTARIIPLYRSSEKLKKAGFDSRGFRRVIKSAIEQYSAELDEIFTAEMLKRYSLPELRKAVRDIHFPETLAEADIARKRLAFNEMFFLQFYLAYSRFKNNHPPQFQTPGLNTSAFHNFTRSLPFEMTGDQIRSINEICADINSGHPMNRLLQGDVGSGKTAVAAAVMFMVSESGAQAALMAPTEILAYQHWQTMNTIIPGETVCGLLTGSTPAVERKTVLEGLSSGKISLVVGTHSLFQDDIEFKNLSLAVIDEQHRFGVAQRAALRRKGKSTHLLVMTATPIPRTLCMTFFGDMDVSVLKQKPSGRRPVKTLAFPESRINSIYNSMRKYLSEGRQIYYVLPLVEDSEKTDLKSAQSVHRLLSETVFPDFKVDMIHGKMKSAEKETIMQNFESGRTGILVTTTVIEVGIDISNANVIIIHHPERFGLSQLHQLRGRVGRGTHDSFCVLLHPDDISSESMRRIDVMLRTTDGFVIAEEDLMLRGAGEITGVRQHGATEFEFTDLASDSQIIQSARIEAQNAFRDFAGSLPVDGHEETENDTDNLPEYVRLIRHSRILEILS